jgi:methionyl-tRNA synthetase
MGQLEQHQVNRTWVIYTSTEALRVCGILLQPFMPAKMGELLDALGVRSDRRHLDFACLGADYEYGEPLAPLGKAPWQALFPPPISEN